MRRYFENAEDGKQIYVTEWEIASPKGLVQISHGMAEHMMRYDRIARRLNEAGYLVFGDDHRCFGGTDRQNLGYTEGDNWEGTLSDMALLTELYQKRYPSLPLVLFGHSYGSFLSQAYLERHADKLSGAILCGSCMMKNPAVSFGHVVAKLGCVFRGEQAEARLIRKLTFGMYDRQAGGNFISSIAEECEKYQTDELCGCTCSNAFYLHFFAGLKKIYKKEALRGVEPNLPLLLIAGENDPVGEMGKGMKKLEKMYLGLGCKDVTLRLFSGCRHEILNDTCRAEADEAILEFLEKIQGRQSPAVQ